MYAPADTELCGTENAPMKMECNTKKGALIRSVNDAFIVPFMVGKTLGPTISKRIVDRETRLATQIPRRKW
uniref:Uncharacterized protein n=1 Tax=Pristionchus pacificus TaxID=54126 RepID=A0A2A6CPF7_PRIPA|eukprot:PDM79933.1 hypothetical protein PRIPAC_32512 [Pristionchus pacificus]